jgi:cation diffusion facilitator family transporter
MHTRDLAPWQHRHDFHEHRAHAEKRTRLVIILTFVMMIAEITAGTLFNSMALLADGWHMGTHVFALSITAGAYLVARRYARHARFTFGTGKVGVLGGFTSAVVLGVIALIMAAESVTRFFQPLPIRFDDAILVAAIGLVVNVVSAWLLADEDDHHHHHHQKTDVDAGRLAASDSAHDSFATSDKSGEHDHAPGERDHNLRAAYLHVIADAFTSVTALIALVAGKFLGWTWMDPAMGIIGAGVISVWAAGLLRDTGALLLDASVDPVLSQRIRNSIEKESDDRVTDLHVWELAPGRRAVIVSVVSHAPKSPDEYRDLVERCARFSHVSVEVHQCRGEESASVDGRR